MSKDWQKKASELREEGYSNRAIGRKLGKDESVVRRYFKRLAEFYDEAAGSECNHTLEELLKKYREVDEKYKVKDNSRILIISDMHIPYHHPDTLAFLQHLKEKYEPTRVICLGDELDKHSLSFHDSDPNLPSAGDELKLALPVIQKLKEMFPVMDILESNHGSLLYRKAHASGIPKQYLKSYNEVLGVDSGWQWHYDMVVDLPNGQKCYFHHGKSANVTKTSQTMSMCSVQGHFHETFKIEYWANPIALYWAMQTGCLIDDKSYAFNYNNVNLKRPIIGTGLIIDSQPILEPMVLLNDGRWIHR
jgi:GMP synthase-like glutamine amidotransferase